MLAPGKGRRRERKTEERVRERGRLLEKQVTEGRGWGRRLQGVPRVTARALWVEVNQLEGTQNLL